jgi:RNA polymerase sigma-70 factor (ECF subfamily)
MTDAPDDLHPAGVFDLLISLARSGSSDALGQIFESCRPVLAKLAHGLLDRHLRAKMDNLDLVQEVFLQVKKCIGDFKGESPGEWEAWLKQILTHLAKETNSWYRQTAKRNLGLEVRLGDNIARFLQTRDDAKIATRRNDEVGLLRTILRKLPRADRHLIVLHYVKGWPLEKIAKARHRSNGSVRKQCGRAMERAKREARSLNA